MSSFSKQRHNPWCDDHVVSGNLNNILLTAEKAGLLRLVKSAFSCFRVLCHDVTTSYIIAQGSRLAKTERDISFLGQG